MCAVELNTSGARVCDPQRSTSQIWAKITRGLSIRNCCGSQTRAPSMEYENENSQLKIHIRI